MVDVAWHAAVGTRAHGYGELIAEPRITPQRTPCQSGNDYSEELVVLGRLKPGTTTESRRVVHVIPLLPEQQHSPVVTARCGTALPVCDTQLLPGLTGMPCESCVMTR